MPRWSSSTRCTRRSSWRSCGATSSRRRRRRRRRGRAREALRRLAATRSARCSRRSCARRRFYEGPPLVKPPVVYSRRHAARARRTIIDEAWVWLSDDAGQRLYHPPDVSGWDDKRWLDTNTIRARWDLVNYVAPARRRPGQPQHELPGRDARAGGRRRARVLATIRALTADDDWLRVREQSAARRSAPPRRQRQQRARCAPSARTPFVTLIAVSADSRPADARHRHHQPALRELLPLRALRRRATAGRGLRSRPACRCPPAPACRGARSWPAQRPRADRLRRRRARPERSSRDRRARPPARPHASSRSSAPAASTRCRCSRPIGDSELRRRCAARSRSTADPRVRVRARTPRLRWHPAPRRCATCTPPASSRVLPGDRLRPTRTSRTSPRATTGRSATLDPAGRVGWLGRYLDRHGVADNPLQGLLARLHAVAGARDGRRPGRGRSATRVLRLLDARRLGPERSTTAARRLGRAGQPRAADPALADAPARAARMSDGAAQPAWPAAGPHEAPGRRRTSPSGRTNGFPRPARVAGRDDPARAAAARRHARRQRRLRHARRTRTRRCRPTSTLLSRSLAAFQADLEARGSPTGSSIHVWSEFGRRPQAERLGHRPRRGRRRAS